jgi:DnaJ-class molecular chaperone
MKKCHKCSGKGFVLSHVTVMNGFFSSYEKSIKSPCPKCYGQGKK